MDYVLQALLTLLSMLGAVLQLNYAFYNATTAYMCRRQAIIKAICDNSLVQQSCDMLFQVC